MSSAHPILSINGLTPFTTIDFPEQLAAVIFCQGCAWRCGYCHNSHLLDVHATKPALSYNEVSNFLQSRRGLLDAVVFSGGEPTLQKGLLDAVLDIRNLGFKVGLHTAGINSQNLAKILPYLDWIGFDAKAPFADYVKITNVPNSGTEALKSAKLILESGVVYEFRTTVHPQLLTKKALLELAALLADLGVQQYALQDCRTKHCLNPSLQNLSYNEILRNSDFVQAIRTLLPQTIIR